MPPKPSDPTVMCPYLNQGRFNQPPPSPILGAPKPPDVEALPCQGPACALYLAQRNAIGQVVGGTCSHSALPVVLQQVGAALMQFLDSLKNQKNP